MARTRWSSLASIALVVGTLSGLPAAEAGSIFMADGAFDAVTDSNYTSDGQFWHNPNNGSIGPSTGSLTQIALDFGTGAVTGLKFSFEPALGRVNFLNSAGVATGQYIAPMDVVGGYDSSYDNGFWTFGELNPAYLKPGFPVGPFVYDTTKTLKAYRFLWPAQCPKNTPHVCAFEDLVGFQAVLIQIDPEDFVLQFNYNNGFGQIIPAGSKGSFLLGTNTATYTGPFVSTGPDYCFHNGVLLSSCSTVTAVPEPQTAPLVAAGLLLLGGMAWHRRRSTPRVPLAIR